MSGTRRAAPERPAPNDPWESRLIAEVRRLSRSSGPLKLSHADLDAAARDLLRLQRGLTGERDLIGSAYMDERSRLSSYLLFYWSVSRAQMRGLLSMAFAKGNQPRPSASPLRILDLGSGPAPCSIAAAEWLGVADARIVACDRSGLALESGGLLAESAGFNFIAVSGWDATASQPPDGPFDIIILGHLLNELWKGMQDRVARRYAFMRSLLGRLAPRGIIVVLEPATLAASRDMLALRDLLAAEGINVLAPCFRNGPCPALAQEGQSCHSDFSWSMNSTLRDLSRRTGLDKGLVKTAGFVFAAPSTAPSDKKGQIVALHDGQDGPAAYRVVSEPMLNKAGRLRILVCGEDGRFPLSAKPGEGYPAEALFLSLKRSDRIELAFPAHRESGLALGPETKLSRLSPDVS